MKLRWLTGLLALALAVGAAAGQEKKDSEKPATKGKTKAPVPLIGYKAEMVRGFTLYVSDESKSHLDDEKYDLKPREVLDKELAGIERVMPPKMLALL
jgi:hypothetical protein